MKNLIILMLVFLTNLLFAQNNWIPINVPDTISPTTINAENEGFLYTSSIGMSGNNFIIRSHDDGLTWEKLDFLIPYSVPIYTIRYHPSGVLFVGTLFSIYKSVDNGDTFTEVYSDYSDCPAFEIDFSPNGDVFAIGDSQILKSTNLGESWDVVYSKDYILFFVDIGFGNMGEVYTVGIDHFSNEEEGFYRSLNNGETWESIGIKDKELHSLSVSSDGTILVSGAGGVFMSKDQGSDWVQISDLELDVMESFSNDKLIGGKFLNDQSGCWLSKNWGYDWENLLDTVINPYVDSFSVSPSGYIYAKSSASYNMGYQLFKSSSPLDNKENNSIATDINIYPNPSTSSIFVDLIKYTGAIHYSVINQSGQIVLSGVMEGNEINTTNLNPGFYIIEFNIDNKTIRKKITII